jgi:hypothetical protein
MHLDHCPEVQGACPPVMVRLLVSRGACKRLNLIGADERT